MGGRTFAGPQKAKQQKPSCVPLEFQSQHEELWLAQSKQMAGQESCRARTVGCSPWAEVSSSSPTLHPCWYQLEYFQEKVLFSKRLDFYWWARGQSDKFHSPGCKLLMTKFPSTSAQYFIPGMVFGFLQLRIWRKLDFIAAILEEKSRISKQLQDLKSIPCSYW